MREFRHTKGGRYDYSEDIHGLQEFAKSLTSLFEDCGMNFVLSGCEIDGNNYSGGYVWFNGKIRYVKADSFALADGEKLFIEVDDSNGNTIDYGDTSQGVMNISYGAKYNHSKVVDETAVFLPVDGVFPKVNDTIMRYYTLVKSGKKQTFNCTLSVGKMKARYGWGLSVYNGNYEMRYDYGSEFSFYHYGSLVYKFKGMSFYNASGDLVFSLGSSGRGTITLPSMTSLKELTVSGNTDMQTIKLNGDDILSIFAYTNYPIDTGWLHPVNSKTNAEIPSLYVRQIRERVIIKGVLPKAYVTSFNDTYVSVLDKSAGTINESSWVLYKLNIKLPSAITVPNANRLPGCVLSSNYQSVEDKACNNVELHVGTDNYLYINGKPIGMDWYTHTVNGVSCSGPTINFDYLID